MAIDLTTAVIVSSLFLFGISYLLLKRRSEWYRLYLIKDFRNPTARPKSYYFSTKVKDGIEVGYLWNHIYSITSVNHKAKPIVEKPDLNAVSFNKMLFAVRGVTGKSGDGTLVFIRIPILSEYDEKTYEEAQIKNIETSLPSGVWKGLSQAEQLTTFENLRKAIQAMGYQAKSSTDPLLREEKVTYAAINSDSANYIMQNMQKWQKITMLMIPLLLGVSIFINALGYYIVQQQNGQAQQATFTYETQLVNEMNANNQYFYAVIKSLNIYGVKPPVNFTVQQLQNGSIVPSVPSIPKIQTGATT